MCILILVLLLDMCSFFLIYNNNNNNSNNNNNNTNTTTNNNNNNNIYSSSIFVVVVVDLVATLLEVSEREEGVVALHLPIGPLKTRSGFEPVPRCEPSTYQPISRWHSHCVIGAGNNNNNKNNNNNNNHLYTCLLWFRWSEM